MPPLIGTAGWSIPASERSSFPNEGTTLERYAAVMPSVEVNTSFYRPHRRQTWERWAASTPDDFRFSVKMPKEISHVRRLIDVIDPLDRFMDEVGGLEGKLDILLLQLPPSFAFDRATVGVKGSDSALQAAFSNRLVRPLMPRCCFAR
ncbi:DUF72 domain-containing protein [Sphingomonas floccifaciens]|uniref:DUF72 domain-containing protein n=1 Tax=Sphingomonas floccifaciens TaxID=1844115 RepID=A0ABW4NBP3_9SPHN